MVRQIGLETSSLMPLLEITPRTLPLQKNIADGVNNGYEFFLDRYSIIEAREQILTSYKNALKSLSLAKNLTIRDNIKSIRQIVIVFIKTLAENWYGREETLRWSDVICDIERDDNFFDEISEALNKKKDYYLNLLKEDNQKIFIRSSDIKSYWVSPSHIKELAFEIIIIKNRISVQEFFEKLQPIINSVYKEKISLNDMIDFYHLYSLYYDGNINEIWSCNQNFVKRHERYLNNLDSNEFSEVFRLAKIRRIKA